MIDILHKQLRKSSDYSACTDQKNSDYRHFLHSNGFTRFYDFVVYKPAKVLGKMTTCWCVIFCTKKIIQSINKLNYKAHTIK